MVQSDKNKVTKPKTESVTFLVPILLQRHTEKIFSAGNKERYLQSKCDNSQHEGIKYKCNHTHTQSNNKSSLRLQRFTKKKLAMNHTYGKMRLLQAVRYGQVCVLFYMKIFMQLQKMISSFVED